MDNDHTAYSQESSAGLTELTGTTSEASTITDNPEPTSSTSLLGSGICTSQCCPDSLQVFQVKDESVIKKYKDRGVGSFAVIGTLLIRGWCCVSLV